MIHVRPELNFQYLVPICTFLKYIGVLFWFGGFLNHADTLASQLVLNVDGGVIEFQ